MANPRRRRLLRRAALAAAPVLLLGALAAWSLQRDPPEVRKSRAVRLGMTQQEARSAMGTPYQVWFFNRSSVSERWLVFGEWTSTKIVLMNSVCNRLGLSGPPPADFEDWPVRVRIDTSGRVDRIERGEEVEPAGR